MKSVHQDSSPRLLKFQERLQSPYFSQEMLFEYFKNELNEQDAKITEKYLSESVSLRQDFADMQSARQLMGQLRGVKLSDNMLARVQTTQSMSLDLAKRLDHTQWPSGLKQSVMVIGGAIGVLAILLVVPWGDIYHQMMQNQSPQVVLVESTRTKSDVDLTTYENQETPEFTDEKDVKENTEHKEAQKIVATETTAVAKVDIKGQVPSAHTPPPVIPTPIPAKPHEIAQPNANAASAAVSGGFLYRGRVFISNIQDTEPKITEKIIELGGRKAGEVALGWKKTSQSAYYHFTMPENKLNDLNQFLALYGEPKIVKEKHPRVMAEGIVRLIIEIEEAKK